MLLVDLLQRLPDRVFSWFPQPDLAVTRFDLPVRDLPEELEGFTIAQVSDIHVGPTTAWGPQHVDQAVQVILCEKPDLIVNTGDYLVDVPAPEKLRTTIRHFLVPDVPNLAVAGNHDYAAEPDVLDSLRDHLRSEGIDLLENRGICVHKNGAGVSVFGLTEDMPGWDDIIEHLQSSGRPRVVLVHEPDRAELLPSDSADLVLSGHTHGGQIAIPPFVALTVRRACGSRYVEGMYNVNGNPLYVNRGLGHVGLPLRFRARPEVTLIRLTR